MLRCSQCYHAVDLKGVKQQLCFPEQNLKGSSLLRTAQTKLPWRQSLRNRQDDLLGLVFQEGEGMNFEILLGKWEGNEGEGGEKAVDYNVSCRV